MNESFYLQQNLFFAPDIAVNIRSGSFLFRNHHDEGPLGPFCPKMGARETLIIFALK